MSKSIFKGGKYIARGAYGCVYGPNLPGAKYIREDKYISKIVNNSDFQQEFTEVANLGIPKIDPEAKFTIYPLEADTIADFDLANENDFADCDIIDKVFSKINKSTPKGAQLSALNKFFVNIIQSNGGQSLDKFLAKTFVQDPKVKAMIGYRADLLSKEIFDTILVKMINAFKAVLLFNVNGICHRDIKTPNLTVEPTFRLIDFGLSTKQVDFSKLDHQDYADSGYPVWPLDYDVLPKGLSEYNKIKNLSDSELLKYSSDLYNNILDKYVEYGTISSVNNIVKSRIPKELTEFLKQYIDVIKNSDKKSVSEAYKQSLLSIDTHSLGLVLMNITMCLERGIRVFFGINTVDYKKYKSLIDGINSIAAEMVHGNPFKRISIDFAIELYLEQLVNHGIITKEQFNKNMVDRDTIVATKKAPVELVVAAKPTSPKPAIAKVPTPKPVIAKVPTPKPVIAKVPTPKELNKIEQCYNNYTMGQLKDILSKNKIEGRSKITNKTNACELLIKLGLV